MSGAYLDFNNDRQPKSGDITLKDGHAMIANKADAMAEIGRLTQRIKQLEGRSVSGVPSTDLLCYADIWIHTHYKTGEVVQVSVNRWNGERSLLEIFEEEDIGDIKELLDKLPNEEDISVCIEFDCECGTNGIEYFQYVKDISLHNKKISK